MIKTLSNGAFLSSWSVTDCCFVRAGARFVAIMGFFVCVSVAAVPGGAQAAEIVYGDMMGTDVTFIGVREASDDPLPLYGAPNLIAPPAPTFPCVLANNCTVNGNSLTFNPALFNAASAAQVPPSDTTDGQLLFMAQAKPGKVIQNMQIQEGGALTVAGPAATTTNDTYVDVSAVGFVTVLAIDGVDVNPIAIPIDVKFNFGVGGNGTWRRIAEGAANGQAWQGLQLLNISQELANRGHSFQFGATKVNFNLDNTLFAQSEPTGTAMIDKKLFFIVTFNIPEPASASLVLIALAMLGFVRRGRN